VPHSIENSKQIGTLWDYVGASVTLKVDVLDWQDDVDFVWLSRPKITGKSFTFMTHECGSTWTVELTNNKGAGPGEYIAEIVARSGYFYPFSQLIDFVTITVVKEGPG
jgi:hypothetical protein